MPLITKCMCLCLVLFFEGSCVSKRYHNYSLLRGIPDTERKLNFLKDLGDLYSANYWKYPGLVNMPVDFIIAPEKVNNFLGEAILQGVQIKTLIEDIQSAFDVQTVSPYILRNKESFNWESYFKLNDIYNWLSDLKRIYSNILSVESIGKTHENRQILVAKVVLPSSYNRPKVIIEGGIHAREWISISFVTYFLYQVLTSANSTNEKLRSIASEYDWYFVPILNPDGYEYSHTKDRLYRKNRRDVDLNRNFDYAFGTEGVSKIRSKDVYCGEAAFTEAESLAMRDFCYSIQENLKYYFSFHSYGQYVIIPYGNTSKHLNNYKEMKKLGTIAAKRIARWYSTSYTVGTSQETVGYLTSGGSTCWVKNTLKVPYVLTFELRDNGVFGFALPPDQIIPTCHETLDGILSLLEATNGGMEEFIDTPGREMAHSVAQSNVYLSNIYTYYFITYIFCILLILLYL